jgi:excisionase family DNA binding protein
MSSTLQLKKICEHCKQKFIAKKSTTKYCSHRCNSRAYKQNVKLLRTQLVETELVQQTNTSSPQLTVIQQKQFLDIQETCVLLKCGESTLRKLISKGDIPTLLIGRKHIIRRTDIELLFDKQLKNDLYHRLF